MATQYTAGLAQGQVLTADIMNQIGAAWETWTPTLTGMSIGNGTVTGRYGRIGKNIFCKLDIIFGSTTTMTGPLDISPPFTAQSNYGFLGEISGSVLCRDVSANQYYVMNLIVISTTTFRVTRLIQNGPTEVGIGDISATTPMTWAVGDFITMQFMYEAA